VVAGEPEPETKPTTREIYAGSGWSRGDYLGNQKKITDGQVATFSDPEKHEGGKFYLQGTWSIDSESVTHIRATEDYEDYIAIKYQAASVNVVVRPRGVDPFRVIATIDGKPVPAADWGDDIMADSQGTTFLQIDGPRMYNVVRSIGSKSGELKLHAGSPDFSLYTYAFSG
jgi:hypothetical protein